MKLYENNRNLFLYLFIIVSVVIAIGSLLISDRLVKGLAQEERSKMSIWAEATKELASSKESSNMNLIVHILQSNTTIPAIHYDPKEEIYTSSNIRLPEENIHSFLAEKANDFKNKNEPIEIKLDEDTQYIYYDDSHTLKQLQLFPYIQLGVLFIIIGIGFFALFSTMKREQDRVWVGLSKETAHQLGTPISSLMAWTEYLKLKNIDESIINDMDKDISRLQTITDRFSKIGSTPALERLDICEVVNQSVSYLEKRISKQIIFIKNLPDEPIYCMISESLFGWVIENITKNAVDAMSGKGTITYTLTIKNDIVRLDIQDTGKGIPKSKFNTIFNPGYTSKSRGWGLGLSLTKRIVESYHEGKIYVKWSEINKGTKFRIKLKIVS